MKNFIIALVSIITVCCFLAAIGLALYGPDPLPPDLKQILDACLSIGVTGMLTLLGIAGKVFLQPQR